MYRVVLLTSLLCLACEAQTTVDAPPPWDAGADRIALGPTPDAGPDAALDAGRPPRGTRVEIDLSPYLTNPGAPVRVFVARSSDDLIGGEAATGRVGDYVLESDSVRFVVQQAERTIGPCPWGGNIIDADIRREGPGRDVVGEICPFFNAGTTMAADAFEILSDGSDGIGVLAVTGHIELLDFINLRGIAAGFLDGLSLRLPFDTDALLPMSVTIYYILRAGEPGVRVITALRNESSDTLHFPMSHLIDSGGDVRFFSPDNSLGGFGYAGLSVDQLAGEPLMLLAFRGAQSSHTYVPEPVEGLGTGLPNAGRYFAVAGVAVSLLGATDLIRTLLVPASAVPDSPAYIHLEPGTVQTLRYWHLVGDGGLSSTLDFAMQQLGMPLGTITGTVRDPAGAPMAQARVSAVQALEAGERTLNQALTDAAGRFQMAAPAGTYELRAERTGQIADARPSVDVVAAQQVGADLVLQDQGTLEVQISVPGGARTPAKVTVACVGVCPQQFTSRERDVTFDGPPAGVAATAFVGVSGVVEIVLAPGAYQITVSRGPEWSVWPRGALANGGEAIEIVAGEQVVLAAEIAHVVDTAGAMSGDFHVHGVNSPDSPVLEAERVRIFMAEGVDVLVSSDHDFITDYAPFIEAAGAGDELTSLIGEELTTFDYGHFNGFPLTHHPESRNGGAFDWAGGAEAGHTPAEIFEWVSSHPGEQVVQVNHPSGGYFRTVRADVLRGLSFADPELFRLDVPAPDPETGDTHLWDEGFTALEVMNGHSRDSFWRITRWWLTMVGRGFTPTGTATSDTHKAIRSLGGSPRTWVLLDAGQDRPRTMHGEHFAAAVNAGRAIGSNGPFFRVVATNQQGETAGLGDTLSAAEPVTISVTVDVPEWMHVDTLQVFANPDIAVLDVGTPDDAPIEPTLSLPIEFAAEELLEVAPGHHHKVKTLTFELTPAVDTFVVLIVSGDAGPSMFPVLHSRGVRPFGWSNPLYLDADGGGYDHPPFAALANQKAAPKPRADPAGRLATEADIRRLIRATAHQH